MNPNTPKVLAPVFIRRIFSITSMGMKPETVLSTQSTTFYFTFYLQGSPFYE